MLDQVLALMFSYKYLALFAVTFFASLLNITPASPSLIASGSLIATGYLSYYPVLLFGFLGTVLGDIIAYWLSFRYSREVLGHLGFKKIINSPKFWKIEKIFEKKSAKTIFFSRFFLTSFGPVVNLVAGLSKTNYKKFIFYDLLGEAIYVFWLTGIGYLFANNWQYMSNMVGYIGIFLVVGALAILTLYFKRKKIL